MSDDRGPRWRIPSHSNNNVTVRIADRVSFYGAPLRRYAASALTRQASLPRRLLIFTPGRAGSELLVTLVNSHPLITCDGEILQRPDRLPPVRPFAYVRGAASISLSKARATRQPSAVYGWKLVSTDLRWHPRRYPSPTEFLREATGDDGLLVVLRRHNFIAQALSYLHAEATQYHFRSTDKTGGFQKLTVDPEQLLAQTWTYEFEDKWVAEVTESLQKLELFYENDLVGPSEQQKTVDRVVLALGLAPAPVGSDLKRVSPLSPSERIENIDEVRSVFAPTRFARLLDVAVAPRPDLRS